jgi:hypothetical protein
MYEQFEQMGKSEFWKLDLEVLDDKIVIKFIKCAMEDYNGPII